MHQPIRLTPLAQRRPETAHAHFLSPLDKVGACGILVEVVVVVSGGGCLLYTSDAADE